MNHIQSKKGIPCESEIHAVGITPLIETFVETPRYTGAVYRASGWIHVGATQGRGRYYRDRQFDKPKKMSGSDPFDGIGNAHSTAKISRAIVKS